MLLGWAGENSDDPCWENEGPSLALVPPIARSQLIYTELVQTKAVLASFILFDPHGKGLAGVTITHIWHSVRLPAVAQCFPVLTGLPEPALCKSLCWVEEGDPREPELCRWSVVSASRG